MHLLILVNVETQMEDIGNAFKSSAYNFCFESGNCF